MEFLHILIKLNYEIPVRIRQSEDSIPNRFYKLIAEYKRNLGIIDDMRFFIIRNRLNDLRNVASLNSLFSKLGHTEGSERMEEPVVFLRR